jgi:ribA/ribD-fused uncharacterized protein
VVDGNGLENRRARKGTVGSNPTPSAILFMYPANDQQLNFETDDTVYFFIHGLDPLNNWSAHAVRLWGETFPTVEHAYHYRKFYKTNPEAAAEIIAAPSPWAAMRLERQYKADRPPDWHNVKASVMAEIAKAKVAQNDDVRECLLATGLKTLVENSPWDSFWGIGPDGKGKNVLGKILMQIRDEVRASAD